MAFDRRAFAVLGAGMRAARSQSDDLKVTVRLEDESGVISPLIHSQYNEHIRRLIDEWIWVGESSGIPNEKGFRPETIEALRRVRPNVVRWPGGCFAGTYRWEDGVGPDRRSRSDDWWLREKDAVSARTAFERALELLPQHAESHNNLGAILAEAGEPGRAIPHFRAALDSQPANADALNNLGNAYMQLGRKREAREMFESALAVHPGYAEALNNLGIIFGEQGDLPEAWAHFRQALDRRPDYPEAANNLALVHAAVGEIEEALRVASASIRRNPDFEAVYLTLARLHVQAGRAGSAAQTLRVLLARHPNRAEAQAFLSDLGVQ